MVFHIYNPSIYSHLPSRQNLKAKIYINKRNFSTSSKINSAYTDWPHIPQLIEIIEEDEENKKREGIDLRECDYSVITSAILPYYFYPTPRATWIITPEYVLPENHKPDYTIFLWSNNITELECMIHVVVEVKSKTGHSWHKLLEQMWNQADKARGSKDSIWAIGQKGF